MGENYTFAVARIRVLEKGLLTDADIAQMATMKDDEAVVSFLTDRGWGDENSGKDASKVLSAESVKLDRLIRSLGVSDDIMNILSIPQVYHNLKTAVKDIATAGDSFSVYYDIPGAEAKTYLDILRDKRWKDLPENMRIPAETALDAMLKNHDGQLSDVIIDRACLDEMAAVAKKTKYKILRNYLQKRVLVTDVKIAVRGARTGKSFDFIKKALSPVKGIDTDNLARAASESDEALINYLSEHSMGEGADALKVSITEFEKWCDDSITESLRPEKMNPFTIGPIVAYYLGRTNEIKAVRVLITAKKNGFPEEAVKERARRMYG